MPVDGIVSKRIPFLEAIHNIVVIALSLATVQMLACASEHFLHLVISVIDDIFGMVECEASHVVLSTKRFIHFRPSQFSVFNIMHSIFACYSCELHVTAHFPFLPLFI